MDEVRKTPDGVPTYTIEPASNPGSMAGIYFVLGAMVVALAFLVWALSGDAPEATAPAPAENVTAPLAPAPDATAPATTPDVTIAPAAPDATAPAPDATAPSTTAPAPSQ